MIDQVFILLLALVAVIVAVGTAATRNMWRWIIAYWAILTLKNAVSFLAEVFG